MPPKIIACIPWGKLPTAAVRAAGVQRQNHETVPLIRPILTLVLARKLSMSIEKSVYCPYTHACCIASSPFPNQPRTHFGLALCKHTPLSPKRFSAARVTAGLLTVGCRVPCEQAASLWRQGLTHLECETAPEKERNCVSLTHPAFKC